MEPQMTLVMIPKEQLESLQSAQQDILQLLRELHSKGPGGVPIRHVTALQFMNIVGIKRSKFDQLVQTNKIKVIKKKRKIYVPVSQIDFYFNDSSIQ